MLTLRRTKLSDCEFINRKLTERSGENCELCFANMYIWRCGYDIMVADYDDMLLVRMEDDTGYYFLPPAGNGNMEAAVKTVIDYFAKMGLPPRFSNVTMEDAALIEAAAPGVFTVHHIRDADDYVHLTESLATLEGKAFHGKRGHVKKFKSSYNFEYRPITKDLIPAVLELSEIWCKQHIFCDSEADNSEFCATKQLFASFDELGVIGGAVFIDGEMVGFSAGTPRYPGCDTLIVHLEKALTTYDGVYSAVNNMFMTDAMEQGFKYANREEDMGIAGLRKSKLSYNPELLLENFELVGR